MYFTNGEVVLHRDSDVVPPPVVALRNRTATDVTPRTDNLRVEAVDDVRVATAPSFPMELGANDERGDAAKKDQ